jgi:hypothetical protein
VLCTRLGEAQGVVQRCDMAAISKLLTQGWQPLGPGIRQAGRLTPVRQAWLRSIGPLVVFVDGPLPDHVQLRLMSLCKHFILANSTFGWWAAYLSLRGVAPCHGRCIPGPQSPLGVVVAPQKWFGPAGPSVNPDDLFPADWILVGSDP